MYVFMHSQLLPVICKKDNITGISFALRGGGDQPFSPNPRSGGFVWFCRERNWIGIVVTWFSQYSGSKVQNFPIISHLWHAIFSDRCMQSAWFIYNFIERNKSFLKHIHTWSHLLWFARQSCKMLKFRYIFHAKE
jgi:hypothetical protein